MFSRAADGSNAELRIMKETSTDTRTGGEKISGTWAALSPAEKKRELFRRQKELLATFLATGAISRAQHDRSLNCLIEKMGIREESEPESAEHGIEAGKRR